MSRCETCGNEYDKAFEIKLQGQSHIFDSSNAPSMRWRWNARTAAVKLSATVSRVAGRSTAALIARVSPEFLKRQIGSITRDYNNSQATNKNRRLLCKLEKL